MNEISQYITSKISHLPQSETSSFIRRTWNTLLENEENLFLQALTQLAQQGVEAHIIKKLIDTFMLLGIDVSNSWTSIDILKDIVGFMSKELIGNDLGAFKSLIKQIKFSSEQMLLNNGGDSCEEFTSISEVKQQYNELKRQQQQLILSANPFQEISEHLSQTSSQFMRETLEVLLPVVWRKLNIPPHSPGVIFFRHMKTFASDLDLFYWGQQPEHVITELTRYFLLLGVKVDHYSININKLIIEQSHQPHDILFDIYNRLYFFMGNAIEFNGGVYREYYNTIKPKRSVHEIWNTAYAILYKKLFQINRLQNGSMERKGLKKLYYWGLSCLLFGLSLKFHIPFEYDMYCLFDALQGCIDESEILFIREHIAFINQFRNILQILTGTRWQPEEDNHYTKTNDILRQQGIDQPEKKLHQLGVAMEQLLQKYFSEPEDTTIEPYIHNEEFFSDVWKETSQMYLAIIQLNSSEMGNPFEKYL